MKKFYQILLSMLLIFSLTLTPAFASSYDESAQEMKTMGLFNGTDAGFDLDRALTRAEAAVMLVRLLGAENDAKTQYSAGTISHPFTDVADWASPYVAWLYTNKLANGVSDTLFGSADQCNAQMYCTFVLRALGYSDASGDFTFADATTFAETSGIYSSTLLGDTFLRDQAVAVSYQALATNIKGGTTTLLDKLVAAGTVSQSGAKATLDKITVYRAYLEAEKAYADITAMDMSMSGTIKMVCEQLAEANGSYDLNSTAKVIIDGSNIQMESVSAVKTAGTTTNVSTWLKDGNMYVSSGTEKIKMALDTKTSASLALQQTKSVKSSCLPLYCVDTITSSKTSEGTLYTIALSDSFNGLDLSQMGLNSTEITDMSCELGSMQVLIGNDGLISSIKMNMKLNISMTNEGTPITIACDYDITTKINSTGSTVTIKFPDFSDYTEK